MSGTDIAVWVTFCLLLLASAVQDVRSRRISNALSVGALLVALVHALTTSDPTPLWHYPASFGLVLAGGTLLFSFGWFGGGDTKLFAATAAWFGLAQLAWFVSAVFLMGGLLALLVLMRRLIAPPSGYKDEAWHRLRNARSIPYGVAIAAAAAALSYPGLAQSIPPFQHRASQNSPFRGDAQFALGHLRPSATVAGPGGPSRR